MAEAKLDVKINAKDDASKTLDEMDKRLDKLSKASKVVGASMLAMGGAIVAGAAMSIKKYTEMGSTILELSQKTGISTEALSEWGYALEQNGGDVSTLQMAIKTMSSAIIDANDGLATYQRSFEHLGINYEKLRTLTPEKQFETIAYALADLKDQTLKTAIAQDLFGRSGMNMLPMLAQGRDGVEALKNEAHDLGIVFSQDMAAQAHATGDAMLRVNKSIDGLKMTIAQELVPTLIPLLDKVKSVVVGFREWAEANPELANKLVTLTAVAGLALIPLGTMIMLLPQIVKGFTTLRNILLAVKLTTIEYTAIALAAIVAIYGIINVIRSFKGEAYVGTSFGDTVFGQIKRDVGDLMSKILELMPSANTQIQGLTTSGGLLGDAFDDMNASLKEYNTTLDKTASKQKTLDDSFKSLMDRIKYADSDAGKLSITMYDVYDAMEELGWQTDVIKALYDEWGEDISHVKDALSLMGLNAAQVASIVNKLTLDTLAGTKTLEGYRDTVDNVNGALRDLMKLGVTPSQISSLTPAQIASGARIMTFTAGELASLTKGYEAKGYSKTQIESIIGEYKQGVPTYQHGGPIDEPTLLYGLSSRRVYAQAHAGESVSPSGESITIPIYLDGELIAERVIERVGDRATLQRH